MDDGVPGAVAGAAVRCRPPGGAAGHRGCTLTARQAGRGRKAAGQRVSRCGGRGSREMQAIRPGGGGATAASHPLLARTPTFAPACHPLPPPLDPLLLSRTQLPLPSRGSPPHPHTLTIAFAARRDPAAA
ncbi:hypothetical protein BS78_K332900 [Paspalum vaginatum]|uniref:Uncharacterized protein n=1 Tax=Paspalum vaginatum TaxID=158149 RepID=A0A9W8CGB5_9POAL|nr:hypothetical protein BS78_K332900 [Paspalum vaginatum]